MKLKLRLLLHRNVTEGGKVQHPKPAAFQQKTKCQTTVQVGGGLPLIPEQVPANTPMTAVSRGSRDAASADR